jgi:hypothetical protein
MSALIAVPINNVTSGANGELDARRVRCQSSTDRKQSRGQQGPTERKCEHAPKQQIHKRKPAGPNRIISEFGSYERIEPCQTKRKVGGAKQEKCIGLGNRAGVWIKIIHLRPIGLANKEEIPVFQDGGGNNDVVTVAWQNSKAVEQCVASNQCQAQHAERGEHNNPPCPARLSRALHFRIQGFHKV